MLYEGKPVGTPDAGGFWRVISEHKVKTLFTAPTAFRVIKKEDPTLEFKKKYDSRISERSFSRASAVMPTPCGGPPAISTSL